MEPSTVLELTLVDRILAERSLPTPTEQADNFIQWLGDTLKVPGKYSPAISDNKHGGIVGSVDDRGLGFILGHLREKGLLRGEAGVAGETGHALSFDGWARYSEIRRRTDESFTAFMAMQYNDRDLDRAYSECFVKACDSSGFELVRLDHQPRAGLIDDRLRVAIRKARFLVADLTKNNLGAYWEAGFAEGLGKPVIFTCEQGFFKKKKTHFDTNHQHTVTWRLNALDDACERLTATIRATLPDVARMRDGEEGDAP